MHITIRSRAVSIATGVALLASLFSIAPIAQAASLSTIQIQAITNLLHAFDADPAVVANVQAALEGTAVSTPAVQSSPSPEPMSGGNNSCDVVSGNLHLGTTGHEVSQLQSFLSKDKSIYPEGSVTGYFGPMTEDAVRHWQEAHNIVATGTPDTTGFGVVGPQTLKEIDREMEMECENGDSLGSSNENASSTSSESNSSGDRTASSTSHGN